MMDETDEYIAGLISGGIIKLQNDRIYPTSLTREYAPAIWDALMLGVSDELQELILDGVVEVVGLDAEGTFVYNLTESGNNVADSLLEALKG